MSRISPTLALGISLAVHGGLVSSTFWLLPAGTQRPPSEVRTLNTRTAPPRAMHVTLIDSPSSAKSREVQHPMSTGAAARSNFPTPTVPSVDEKITVRQAASLPPLTAFTTPAADAAPGAMFDLAKQRTDFDALLQKPGPTGMSADRAATVPAPAAGISSDGTSAGSSGHVGAHGTGIFDLATVAESVVFVVDRSASMGPSGSFSAAKHELLAAITALPPTTRFQVIVYNRAPTTLRINGHVDLVPATEANKEAATQCLAELGTEGATDHVRALQAALQLRPDAIYFVTDADDLRADQVRALTVLNHGRSSIHAIEFAGERRQRERSLLQVLAEQNQGQFRSVRSLPE